MSNLGPHEQQLRALREEKAKRRATPRRPITTPPAVPALPKETIMFDTDNAGAVPAPEPRPRKRAATKAKKKPAKKDTRIKARKKPKGGKKAKAAPTARGDLRPGSKLAIISGLLLRPGGCTRADVLEACDWPSVSMQQQAAALGVELKSKKEPGKPTSYWVDPA